MPHLLGKVPASSRAMTRLAYASRALNKTEQPLIPDRKLVISSHICLCTFSQLHIWRQHWLENFSSHCWEEQRFWPLKRWKWPFSCCAWLHYAVFTSRSLQIVTISSNSVILFRMSLKHGISERKLKHIIPKLNISSWAFNAWETTSSDHQPI